MKLNNMDQVEKARRLKRVTKAVVDTFDTDDWHIVETQFPGGEIISNHGRLFRAMSFGDEDYPYCVADVLSKLIEVEEENLDRLEAYVAQDESLIFSETVIEDDQQECIVFISHKAEERDLASSLKDSLASFGMRGFVAHEDIEVTSFWEAEIEKRLRDCDGFIYLSTSLSNASEWCQQEIGWALGRNVPIVALSFNEPPQAFLGQRQARWVANRSWDELAKEVFVVLASDNKAASHLANGLIRLLEKSQSFDESDRLVKLLWSIPKLTSPQIARLNLCIEKNDQVRYANHGTLPQDIGRLVGEKAA